MRKIVLVVVPFLAACGASVSPVAMLGSGSDGGEVIYEGRHYALLEAGEAGGEFVAVEADLEVTCGAEVSSLGWSMGVFSSAKTGDARALLPVVMVSRDGMLFVSDADWSAYHGVPASEPPFAGTDESLAFSAQSGDETWQLSLSYGESAAAQGTVVRGNETCAVDGSVRFTPVAVEERTGAVTIDLPNDE